MENDKSWILGKTLGVAATIGIALGIGKSLMDDQRDAAKECRQWKKEKRVLLTEQLITENLTGAFAKKWFEEQCNGKTAGHKFSIIRLTPDLAKQLSSTGKPLDAKSYVLFSLLDETGDVSVTQLVNYGKISEKLSQLLDGNNGTLVMEG